MYPISIWSFYDSLALEWDRSIVRIARSIFFNMSTTLFVYASGHAWRIETSQILCLVLLSTNALHHMLSFWLIAAWLLLHVLVFADSSLFLINSDALCKFSRDEAWSLTSSPVLHHLVATLFRWKQVIGNSVMVSDASLMALTLTTHFLKHHRSFWTWLNRQWAWCNGLLFVVVTRLILAVCFIAICRR